jgi:hypothetical protein
MTVRRKTSVLMAVIGLVLLFVPSNGWRYLMKTKQAYRRLPTPSGSLQWSEWKEVELTGRAKSVTGGPSNLKKLYYELKSKNSCERWVPSDQITVCDPVEEVIYMDEALGDCSD